MLKAIVGLIVFCFAVVAEASPLATPAPAYPKLLGASCGGVKTQTYVTGFNADGTISGEVYAWTRCSTGGRGSKPKTYFRWTTVNWDLYGQVIILPAFDGIVPVTGFTDTDVNGNIISNNPYADLSVAFIPPDAVSYVVNFGAPLLIGLTSTAALDEIANRGFVPRVYYTANNNAALGDTVASQLPDAGTVLAAGDVIAIWVYYSVSTDTDD